MVPEALQANLWCTECVDAALAIGSLTVTVGMESCAPVASPMLLKNVLVKLGGEALETHQTLPLCCELSKDWCDDVVCIEPSFYND